MIGVSALGPSQKKSDFSNYGLEQISVAAPGRWFRDGFGTDTFRTNGNLILSTYPRKVLQEEGTVDADGNVVPGAEGLVYTSCSAAGACGYYTYLQGTSMASPHAAGVAALSSAFRDTSRGGPASASTRTRPNGSSRAALPSIRVLLRRCRHTPARDGRRTSMRSARAPQHSTGSTASASSMTRSREVPAQAVVGQAFPSAGARPGGRTARAARPGRIDRGELADAASERSPRRSPAAPASPERCGSWTVRDTTNNARLHWHRLPS